MNEMTSSLIVMVVFIVLKLTKKRSM
jgi:hypothetical protein